MMVASMVRSFDAIYYESEFDNSSRNMTYWLHGWSHAIRDWGSSEVGIMRIPTSSLFLFIKKKNFREFYDLFEAFYSIRTVLSFEIKSTLMTKYIIKNNN